MANSCFFPFCLNKKKKRKPNYLLLFVFFILGYGIKSGRVFSPNGVRESKKVYYQHSGSSLELHGHFLPFSFSKFSSTSYPAKKKVFCIFGIGFIFFFNIIRISLGESLLCSLLPQEICLHVQEWAMLQDFFKWHY